MTQIHHLLTLIETFCRAADIAEATLSSRMFSDGKRIAAIRRGSDIGVRRCGAAVAWLSDHWPEGTDWPADVPRPQTLPGVPEAAE